jgi:hypothetical protein
MSTNAITVESVIKEAKLHAKETKDMPMIRMKSIGHGHCSHSIEPTTIQLIKY